GTALVIRFIERGRMFRVVRMDKWRPYTDPHVMMGESARRCVQFGVYAIAADGGGFGLSNNRLLLGRIQELGRTPAMYAIFYSDTDHEPVRDGVLWRWTVSRSGSIGTLFARVKKKLLRFPSIEESRPFLDEF